MPDFARLLGKRAERRRERARSKRNKKFAACIQFTPSIYAPIVLAYAKGGRLASLNRGCK